MNQINQMNMIQGYNQMNEWNQMNQNNNINKMNNINQMNNISKISLMNQMNNNMNLINQINNMNQMNNIKEMNNMNVINPINQINNMNPMNNMNQMNNMNLMNQINQMNDMSPLNQMNIMNLMNQMNETFFQLYQLFQKNMYQMKMGDIKNEEKEEDVYPELKEPKKCIYLFRNDDGKRFGIKIPCSLKNDELYPTAEKFKLYKYSDLKLFHKNKYLKEDETPIDYISDGDEIKIIEEFHDIDFTYYRSYLSKIDMKKTIFICFRFNNGTKKFMKFTLDITVKEMIKMFLLESKIPEKEKNNFRFLFNGSPLNVNDMLTLYQKSICDLSLIHVIRHNDFFSPYKGKKIEAKIYNKENLIMNLEIGTLNTIEQFYNYIEKNSPNWEVIKIQKLEAGEQELKKDDKRTFSSIGIRNNFICNIYLI